VLTTLVGSLVDFARGLSARVVAEGIETAAEAAVLLRIGVDSGQGWHFGRPTVPGAAPAGSLPVPAPRTPSGTLAGSGR
jgi:EAL domain-containing protein (putative c-di-GMP-specific phosphodiesterase class I)